MIRDDIDRAINMQLGYWSELYKSIWAIVPSFGHKYIALDYRSNQPKRERYHARLIMVETTTFDDSEGEWSCKL